MITEDFVIRLAMLSVFGITFLTVLLSLPKFLIRNRSDIRNYNIEKETFTTKITSKLISRENGKKLYKLYIRTPENNPIIFIVNRYQYHHLKIGDIIHYEKVTYINKENSILKEYSYKIIKRR